MLVRTNVLGFLMVVGSLTVSSGCTADPAKQAIETSPASIPVSGVGDPLTVPTVAIEGASSPSTSLPSSTQISPATSGPTPSTASNLSSGTPSIPKVDSAGVRLAAAARSQVGVTTGYDPAYVGLSFPGGDVDTSTGVCSDVVVRALRVLGIDLQERVNLDMKANFSEYPTRWGLTSPDANIDHRRVPNLAKYFARRGYEQPVTTDPRDYRPGDIVWIKLPLDHIGIVSDRTVDGRPLLIHNVGSGAQEEDVLFSWKIVGHYRVLD